MRHFNDDYVIDAVIAQCERCGIQMCATGKPDGYVLKQPCNECMGKEILQVLEDRVPSFAALKYALKAIALHGGFADGLRCDCKDERQHQIKMLGRAWRWYEDCVGS